MKHALPTTDEWPLLATLEPPEPHLRGRKARGRVRKRGEDEIVESDNGLEREQD